MNLILIYAWLLFGYLIQISGAEKTECRIPVYLENFEQANKAGVKSADGHLLQIKKLQFYLSCSSKNIPDTQEYHLIDINNGKDTLKLEGEPGSHWYTGVDSLTQKDGAKEGDLDPFNGMYWAWHSGYIELKLEGVLTMKSGDRQDVLIHAGGFGPLQQDLFPLKNNSDRNNPRVCLNLNNLIQLMISNEIFHSMLPGEKSHLLMKAFSQGIQIR
ncbi:MAG: hypothetical protein RLZZ46_803 [Bacteroidota bacterium]|jgi:hypothetical protein